MGKLTAADNHTLHLGSWSTGNFVNVIYTSPTGPTRVGLDLICGQDFVFHCNPRYDERVLVLNTKTNQHWQAEERPPNFPLGYGQLTQLTAAINDQTIDVYANKKQFCYSYRHRYIVEKVNKINCYGCGTPISMFVGKALPNYEVGKIVYIKGQAPTGKTFTMDFVPSLPHDYKPENIAFHFSVRFNENTVVRNHKINEKWAGEERNGGMPFVPGQPFTMTVVAQKHGFEVGVNGSHFCFFKYRVPLTKEMCVQFNNLNYLEKIEYC